MSGLGTSPGRMISSRRSSGWLGNAAEKALLALQCDVLDKDAVGRFAAAVERWSGRCDILVNNAGQARFSGRDLGSYITDAQKAMTQQLKLPPGYTLVWSGWEPLVTLANLGTSLTAAVALPVAKNSDGSTITGPRTWAGAGRP